MGNEVSLPPGVAAEEREAHKLLHRHYQDGDTCLIHSIKDSSDITVRQNLQEHRGKLFHHWQLKTSRSATPEKRSGADHALADSAEQDGVEARWLKLLDTQNNKGETALFVAAQLGYMEAVQYLLEQGANPWLANQSGGYTPLHVACLQGLFPVVKVLLDDLPSQWQKNPASDPHARRSLGAFARASQPVNNLYVGCTTTSGFTPLHCAVSSQDSATVKAVLAHDPSLYASNPFESFDSEMTYPARTTALHIAAAKGSDVMVELLLRHYKSLVDRAAQAGSLTEHAPPDPRLSRNGLNEQPWQLVKTYAVKLAESLRPTVPLSRLISDRTVSERLCLEPAESAQLLALPTQSVADLFMFRLSRPEDVLAPEQAGNEEQISPVNGEQTAPDLMGSRPVRRSRSQNVEERGGVEEGSCSEQNEAANKKEVIPVS